MVRKAYLTPPDIPEGLTCRTLKMPASKEWLGIFNSALLTTVQNWQWEQVNSTDLTIDEAVAQCQVILDQFWADSDCEACRQPGGMPFIRIALDGSTEEFIDGEWAAPTGDYAVPPITPREGGTPDDQMCLAAKNAMNTLKLLYENLTDSYNDGLTEGEALTQLLIAIETEIAAAVALWAAAIIAVVGLLFGIIYGTLQYITADLWTSDFDRALTCILLSCAANDAGVVTFDYDCVINALAAQTDPFGDLTFDQLRLFGQLAYILQFIGGDGLNLAGATTAISDDNCDCAPEWCRTWLTGDGFSPPWTLDYGDYNSGTDNIDGEQTSPGTGNTVLVQAKINFDPATITYFAVDFAYKSGDTFGGNGFSIGNGSVYGVNVFASAPAPTFTETTTSLGGDSTPGTLTDLWIQLGVPSKDTLDTYCHTTKITIKGTGDCPFGESNCE